MYILSILSVMFITNHVKLSNLECSHFPYMTYVREINNVSVFLSYKYWGHCALFLLYSLTVWKAPQHA